MHDLFRRSCIAVLVTFLLIACACANQALRRLPPPLEPVAQLEPPQIPQYDHVVLIVLENESYDEVLKGPSMPFLKSLAEQNASATNYYSSTHPSIGNYFMLTMGLIWTNNDFYGGEIPSDNMLDHLHGKTWKSYAESLPAPGYTGGGLTHYPYAKRHNPFAYYRNVRRSSGRNNLVPFTQFAKDEQAGALPNFIYIAPNLKHDAHDLPSKYWKAECGSPTALKTSDDWLKKNVGPMVGSDWFRRSGLLIITFDESCDGDNASGPDQKTGGGGHVPFVLVGPHVKPGEKSGTYQHQSTLKMMLRALGSSDFPGYATGAPEMNEFFEKPK